jgi:hypothetical protein
MTTTVTVSEFRENLAKYLNLLKEGHFVELTDGRNKKSLVKLKVVSESTFDWESHIKKMKKMAGKGYFIADEEDRKKLRASIHKRLKKRVLYG